MERNSSYASDRAVSRRSPPPSLPPWETRSVSQVPYLGPVSPPPSNEKEQPQLPWMRSARSHSQPHARPRLATVASAPCGAEYNSPISEDDANTWHSANYLPTLQPSQPAPYETPLYYPAGPRAISQTPAFVDQSPPTPPESISKSSLKSATPPPPEPSNALPGTMSSRANRERDGNRTRTRSAGRLGRDARSKSQPKHDSLPIGKRFKSAFKDIFKKDPIDESQFERISDKHWAEEY